MANSPPYTLLFSNGQRLTLKLSYPCFLKTWRPANSKAEMAYAELLLSLLARRQVLLSRCWYQKGSLLTLRNPWSPTAYLSSTCYKYALAVDRERVPRFPRKASPWWKGSWDQKLTNARLTSWRFTSWRCSRPASSWRDRLWALMLKLWSLLMQVPNVKVRWRNVR